MLVRVRGFTKNKNLSSSDGTQCNAWDPVNNSHSLNSYNRNNINTCGFPDYAENDIYLSSNFTQDILRSSDSYLATILSSQPTFCHPSHVHASGVRPMG